MSTLIIKNVGPIKDASLKLGDLTVLVGPQATGKSIALQCLKLVVDRGQVQQQLRKHGLDWGTKEEFLDAYFGEGMHALWGGSSSVAWEGRPCPIEELAKKHKPRDDEHAFLVPAQRVLALRDGWPRHFTDYTAGAPYTVRDFSEKLRILVEAEFTKQAQLFPQEKRLKKELRDLLALHVFGGFDLRVDKQRPQRRLVLKREEDPLPYLVWSAGQREFVPLLLGLYWLMPPTRTPTRGKIEWVMLEEIEMGLHPRAISVVLLMVLELIARGYRVCVSTHSPQVLEAIWTIRRLQASTDPRPRDLLGLFGAPAKPAMLRVAEKTLEKDLRVYYFYRETAKTTEISSLDPDSPNSLEAAWGGLSEFSQRANAAVAEATARSAR